MCGILGYIKFDGNNFVDRNSILRGLNMMNHRGPDDEGIWQSNDRKCGLAHKRLSIIDLSPSGHQPMVSRDGNYVITYNGEFYNYKEIRKELLNAGFKFEGASDTEVLLCGYIFYGEDIVNKIRGMFSFVIYNQSNNSLFIARDRMGIKPFYYVNAENGFYFASEIRPLFEISGIKKTIRKKSALEYFAFGKTHSPHTMFENVMKLPSATCGIVQNKLISIRKYWTPYSKKLNFSGFRSDKDYENALFDLFRDSVNYRLTSDVPAGIFLSGGVDSTGIVGMINHLGKSKDVFTYSAGFEGQESYDERRFAAKAAKHYGTNHYEIVIKKKDLTDTLPGLLEHIDEPISDSTIIPIFFLSKLAKRNGSIVILNGDGADELFVGYNKWLEYIRFYKYWKLISLAPDFAKSTASYLVKRLFVGRKSQILSDIFKRSIIGTQYYIGDTGALKGTSLYDETIPEEIYDIFNGNYYQFSKMKSGKDYSEWMSYWGLKSIVENVFLYRADRMGMANSIEIRVPYLDHQIVEFGMQLPQNLKYKNNTGKYILKKSLGRIVPLEFLYRKKMGFCVPVNEWVGKEIFSSVFPFFGSMIKEIGLFDNRIINEFEKLVLEEMSDTGSTLLLNLHIFTNWYKKWFN